MSASAGLGADIRQAGGRDGDQLHKPSPDLRWRGAQQ
jgi:hypothetical protein